MDTIVTKDWLKERLMYRICPACFGKGFTTSANFIIRDCNLCKTAGRLWDGKDEVKVLGRALVALYNRQTPNEQTVFATRVDNGVGFTGPDARIGTLGARHFLAHGTLPSWIAKAWLVEKKGYPRICKYANQLNQIANEKKRAGLLKAVNDYDIREGMTNDLQP